MDYWEITLQFKIPTQQWYLTLQKPHLFPKNISHWKSTFTKLARIHHSLSPKCWRLCNMDGTPLHIWWDCHVLFLSFLASLNTLIDTLTGTTETPQMAFVGIGFEVWLPLVHSLVTHVLIAARLSITRKWKSTIILTVQDVISTLNDHCKMEWLFAEAHLTTRKCYKL